MDKKMLIFDMDGVILDSEPLHQEARELMYAEYGIKTDNTLPDPVGKSSSGFWRLVGEKYGFSFDADAMEAEQYSLVAMLAEKKHTEPNSGLINILELAKVNGIKTGVASSSSRQLVSRILDLLGIQQYFDVVVCGDEIANKKPAPDVYKKVLELAGASPCDAVAIEDSDAGIKAAKSAGIYCYGYKNNTSGNQSLLEADKIITRLADIKDTAGI